MAYTFQHGSGTENDPFLIESLADLQGISDVDANENPNFVGKWFKQMVDVDAQSGFITIEDFKECHYDGNNKKISNLTVPLINYFGSDTIEETYINSFSDIIFEYCTNIIFVTCYYVYFNNITITNCVGFNRWSESCRFFQCNAIDTEQPVDFDEDDNFEFYGAISANAYDCEFENCIVENVTITMSYGYTTFIGGFGGRIDLSSILNCKVSGVTITLDCGESTQPDYPQSRLVGGVVGVLLETIVDNVIVEDINIFMRYYALYLSDKIGGFSGGNDVCEISNVIVKNIDIQRINGIPGWNCVVGGFSGNIYDSNINFCLVYNSTIKARYAGGFAEYAGHWGDKQPSIKNSGVITSTYESDIPPQPDPQTSAEWRYFSGMINQSDYYDYENCYALGINILSGEMQAGFIFDSYDDTIKYCINEQTINLDGLYRKEGAGFVGFSMGSQFENCGTQINLNGGETEPEKCYVLGGFAGSCITNNDDSISSFSDCFAIGQIIGAEGQSTPREEYNEFSYGGFIGHVSGFDNFQFENCLAVVDVTKRGEPDGWEYYQSGGFIGMTAPYGSAIVTNCYYDTEVSGHTDTSKGEPKTTLELKNQQIYTNWDFTDIWKIGQFPPSEINYTTDVNGMYKFMAPNDLITVYLSHDPNNGYPYLQFEVKKEIDTRLNNKLDFYVR